MGSLLKDVYSLEFYHMLSETLDGILPSFNRKQFIDSIFVQDWPQKELKQRMRHTAEVLHQFLPKDFKLAVPYLKQIANESTHHERSDWGLAFMFLPDYIEQYGIHEYEHAVEAMECVTQLISCEFAVRPFLIKYPEKMLKQMSIWSEHEHAFVRRLASEGLRPRLPWAMALPMFKMDPTPIFPVLEKLKNDPHPSVRRSVANNLNDIAKDHPDKVVHLAQLWHGANKDVDAVVKHGCRTLLKKAHPEIMSLYGLDAQSIELSQFMLETPIVPVGSSLRFSFCIHNLSEQNKNIRLEYGISFLLNNGKFYKKIFKISEKNYSNNHKKCINKAHNFKVITTRKFYLGEHKLTIIINGQKFIEVPFQLVEA
ncbi:DNA alkylation repair protein [Neisseria sp. Ec49-e6-T10]|uniref:DNA alkylation repair protein n=1 Tax=Neisseria sp. Ec49-e6-T10 TaxID=3140744 RepID=UPI003EBE6F1A